jgi:urease accessory protein
MAGVSGNLYSNFGTIDMKKQQFWQYLVGAIGLTLTMQSVASAHTGVGDTSGFLHGLAHPIGGLDHILAMVAVGLLAAQIGGTALWLVPSAFVVAMTVSSVFGNFIGPLPGVEQGILASDFILGLLLLFAPRLSLAASMSIVGVLAIFHGYAHGVEMPNTVSGLVYRVGFISSTTGLHLLGIGIGLGLDRLQPIFRQRLFRSGGAAIVLGAVYILVNR